MFDRAEMSVEEHAYWEDKVLSQVEIDELLQTKEEAIKMGATHYDDYGNYYMEIDNKPIILIYQLIDNEWETPLSMFLNLKPL